MPDYSKAKIYKIWCGEDVYYGSTVRTLAQRMVKHREGFRHHKKMKCSSFLIFEKYGLENCKIELVEAFPCNSIEELLKREGEYIRNNPCVNKNIPCRTMKEYVEDNKEHIQERRKKYLEENKEYIREREKKYREEHKEQIKEAQRKYREANREKTRLYLREWRATH